MAVVSACIKSENKILKSKPLWGEKKSVSCNHCKDC